MRPGIGATAILVCGLALSVNSCARKETLENYGGPDKLGGDCAHMLFDDWPARFEAFKSKMPPQLLEHPEALRIEFVILRASMMMNVSSRRRVLGGSTKSGQAFFNAFHREMVRILAQYGWSKEDFDVWQDVYMSRYKEYNTSFQAVGESIRKAPRDDDPAIFSPIGQTLVSHISSQLRLSDEDAGSLGMAIVEGTLKLDDILDNALGDD